MSVENVSKASPARYDRRSDRRRGSLRWAMLRLVLLWVPTAAVLALALWNTLFLTLAPWDHRDAGPPELDAVPSQLLFAVFLLSAGRVETARSRGVEGSSTSVRAYWKLSALLIAVGVAALWFLAVTQPVLQ